MKKNKFFSTVTAFLLLLAICTNVVSCGTTVKAASLSDGITPKYVSPVTDLSEGNLRATDFAVRLFASASREGGNLLISPLSVMSALAMTANGAEGNTLAQMEDVLGMKKSELNSYLYSYMLSLPQAEKYKLSLANSIWFTDDASFSANEDFLQTNADYYGADLYKAPFDKRTLRDINSWVKEKTDKMIPKILEDIPPFAVMYLVNALAFDAEWQVIYENYQVRDGIFTKEDGTQEQCEMMYASEGSYLEDEYGKGFIKYYKDRKYAFAALLPNEGMSISDYIAVLDGQRLHSMLENPTFTTVNTAIPKFETEYSNEISSILAAMGMTDALDPARANFDGVGSYSGGNIFINSVIHKTYIQVDERGTRAGAVTSVGLNGSSSPLEPKEVHLDRPFVYMLIDCENGVPFFIGAMTDINN